MFRPIFFMHMNVKNQSKYNHIIYYIRMEKQINATGQTPETDPNT